MQKWIMVCGFVSLMSVLTGCHQPVCRQCQPRKCNQCNNCNGGDRGLMGGMMPGCGCKDHVTTGCRPGDLAWQRGGSDYASTLSCGDVKNEQITPGPPSPTVGYPYYTMRGPRDFLLDNPPTIGR